MFFFGIASFRIDHLVPGLGIVEPVGTDLMGYSIVVEFSDMHGLVSVLAKQLRQGYDVGNFIAKMSSEVCKDAKTS